MTYREDGMILDVDIVEQKDEDGGESITLKVNQRIRLCPFIEEEAQPKQGDTFTVWRRCGSESMCGWHLSNGTYRT